MAYFSPGKLHKSSVVKGRLHGHMAHMCVSVCVSMNMCVGMHTDTSWVNALGVRLVETLVINPQYILPLSLPP